MGRPICFVPGLENDISTKVKKDSTLPAILEKIDEMSQDAPAFVIITNGLTAVDTRLVLQRRISSPLYRPDYFFSCI